MIQVDAHHHVWTIARGDYGWMSPDLSIARDYGLDDLRPLLAGITATVLVQAADSEAETAFMLDVARASAGLVQGVVGWTTLAAPGAPARIAELARIPLLKGLRPMLQDIEDTGWILRPAVQPALAAMARHGLRFDALLKPRHLPVIGALASYLGRQSHGVPGRQHLLDNEYFARIDAMTFAINHDDGQSSWGIDDADVCLVGVSRTSKTPTCLYLANRGIKAANIPIVPGVPLPVELEAATVQLDTGLLGDSLHYIARSHRAEELAFRSGPGGHADHLGDQLASYRFGAFPVPSVAEITRPPHGERL